MKLLSGVMASAIFAVAIATTPVGAQQTAPAPYGTPIGLEVAKKLVLAAESEAIKNNWAMAIAIVDSTGHVVLMHRLDNTQYGSIAVAEDKARTALDYKRPTKAFEDVVAQGGAGLRILALRGALPIEGGLPILSDGKIVGAIGVSGGSAAQDGQVAKAGADALK
jgi:glc operon protein GlcG